jgi:hypothetical protein
MSAPEDSKRGAPKGGRCDPDCDHPDEHVEYVTGSGGAAQCVLCEAMWTIRERKTS